MQSNLLEQAMEAARKRALRFFRYDGDREAKVTDAISSAWEIGRKAPPDVKPSTIAAMAVRRVKSRRQFNESVRSVDVPVLSKRELKTRQKAERVALDPAEFAGVGDNPADIAQVKHDFRIVFETLSKIQRSIAVCLAKGESTKDTAEKFDVCNGRISQIRRLIKERWDALTS